MARYEKHFTEEEARAWLPELRRRFAEIHTVYEDVKSLRAEYERVVRAIRSNGHAARPSEFEARAARLQSLVNDIVKAGIEIKDIERGLVDFPHWRNGEEVFLCWELAEEELGFWHRIEDGYAGREPL